MGFVVCYYLVFVEVYDKPNCRWEGADCRESQSHLDPCATVLEQMVLEHRAYAGGSGWIDLLRRDVGSVGLL